MIESLEIPMIVLEERLRELDEANPMLGHRGCRLGVSHPEIYKMQVEAILDAAHEFKQEQGKACQLELMIPLISTVAEIRLIKEYIEEIVADREAKHGVKFDLKLGTMIELPRAAVISDQLAEHASYFSFGSNDLTQTTYGISRDDIGSFLPQYMDNKILLQDPFSVIDEEGVGALIKMSIEKGRCTKKDIKLGVCGEHAGNPASIEFFERAGLDYISCSPYRVPIARVAAAQSAINNKTG